MLRLHSPLVLAFSLAFSSAVAAAATDPERADLPPRVRPAADAEQRLIHDAVRLSPSVRELVGRLGDTDLFVYVQLTGSPQVRTGSTIFVASTAHGRYLRIQISASLPHWSRIHLLGHELQHALEIGGNGSVTSEEALRALYRRIGHSYDDDHRFETMEARRIEYLVRSELLKSGGKEPWD